MTPIYIPRFTWKPPECWPQLMNLKWLSVTPNRHEYFMSFTPRTYVYGKKKTDFNGKRAYQSNEFVSPVSEILAEVSNSCDTPFNVCFLNRYDNQHQHLGWHADDFEGNCPDSPIAVVSFGAEREIWWKLQKDKGKIPPENRQLLENGSLFVMPVGFQDHYFHRIPKHDKPCGTRISLTFRKFL